MSATERGDEMDLIERWTLCRRTDWQPSYVNPWIVPKGVEPPTADDTLEVFEVVRADIHRGAVEALREARGYVVPKWTARRDDKAADLLDRIDAALAAAGGQ